MELNNQKSVISELQRLAVASKQSVLLAGAEQTGKTYLAKQYAKFLGVDNFNIIDSKVGSIKETIDACYMLDTSIVLCIENLDLGVDAASYALLKFLEEPTPNVFLVITCRNINNVLDTIISRCAVVYLPTMDESDLSQYAKSVFPDQYANLNKTPLWSCIHSVRDIDVLSSLTESQIDYIVNLRGVLSSSESVSGILWKLQKFPDNSSTPIELVLQYIMHTETRTAFWYCCHSCLQDLASGRISSSAVLARFVFNYKYMT